MLLKEGSNKFRIKYKNKVPNENTKILLFVYNYIYIFLIYLKNYNTMLLNIKMVLLNTITAK